MVKGIAKILVLTFLLSFCRCNENKSNSQKNTTSSIISDCEKGSGMYKNYCLSCHGYAISGTYYQPSLDSMYILLKKGNLTFNYKTLGHEILISSKDSIDIEKIIVYMKQKYHF